MTAQPSPAEPTAATSPPRSAHVPELIGVPPCFAGLRIMHRGKLTEHTRDSQLAAALAKQHPRWYVDPFDRRLFRDKRAWRRYDKTRRGHRGSN